MRGGLKKMQACIINASVFDSRVDRHCFPSLLCLVQISCPELGDF